jgi:isoquinoline 1-oxidoreductase beta subunit
VITPAEARSAPFEANTWVTIGTDGTISIASPAAEMGQGSSTALPLILAEELDADWDKVRVVAAPPIDALYGNPRFGRIMYTAGSNAVSGYYDALRFLGAGARQVLLSNAARYWAVPLDELETEPSVVLHRLSSRRMSYGEIAAFAQHPTRPPEPRPERLKARSAFRLIGTDVLRTDLPGKVDGSAKYSIDVRLPGMLYGAILRAPVEGDEPATVKDAAARSIGGVVDVVRLPYGVGVVAETPWAAFQARDALEVAWSRGGRARGFNSDTAAAAYAEAARDTSRSGTEWDRTGDVKAALSQAAATIEAEYQCDYAYHAQMEPLNAVAAVSPDGSRAEIWCGTQSQTMAAAAAAKALGIAPEQVVLHSMLLGGGFGRRGHRDEEFIVDAVLLSQASGRPVKVIWTREDDVRNGRFRPMSVHRLQAGLSAGGDLVAWEHRVAGDEIMPFQDPIRYEGWGRRDLIAILGTELKPYEVPHRSAEQLPQSSGVRTSSLRAIGFGPISSRQRPSLTRWLGQGARPC